MNQKIGVILTNLGSPADPTTPVVRRYLQEFLMDPCVLDIPFLSRALLVYGPISIFRAPKSAHAYEKIWLKDSSALNGSPLLHYSLKAAAKLKTLLGEPYRLSVAMRYQNPSIAQALREIDVKACDELRVLPLYPQFALSATITAEKAFRKALLKMGYTGRVRFLKPFYSHPEFIEAQAETGRALWNSKNYDHVLFSFHGIPERHITKLKKDPGPCLEKPDCCDLNTSASLDFCYRKQSYKNAALVAQSLGLSSDQYSVSFQSRLGRTPWIKPYTDFVIPELLQKGKKRLLVFCPSFVADCLETLEEIAIRERQSFIEKGGSDLKLVPSLNDSEKWIGTLKSFVENSSNYTDAY